MGSVERHMSADSTTDTPALVEFIDTWLETNSFVVDSRTIDFALDLRNLLTDTDDAVSEREPVPAGV